MRLGSAVMPGPSDLPDDLKPLAPRNAAQVRYVPNFHSDMQCLIAKLQDYFVSHGIASIERQRLSANYARYFKSSIPSA